MKTNVIKQEIENWLVTAQYPVDAKAALQKVLSFIDSLSEEPESEELENVAKYCIPDESYHMIIESKEEGSGENVYDYIQMVNMFKAGAKYQKEKDEPITEDLGEYINELSKQFPEVSFAKLSRIAVRVAKWKEKEMQSTIELVEDHAILAGMNKMEQQMMAKAVDVTVTGIREYKEENEVDFTLMLEKGTIPYELEEEIKVIVINKD